MQALRILFCIAYGIVLLCSYAFTCFERASFGMALYLTRSLFWILYPSLRACCAISRFTQSMMGLCQIPRAYAAMDWRRYRCEELLLCGTARACAQPADDWWERERIRRESKVESGKPKIWARCEDVFAMVTYDEQLDARTSGPFRGSWRRQEATMRHVNSPRNSC